MAALAPALPARSTVGAPAEGDDGTMAESATLLARTRCELQHVYYDHGVFSIAGWIFEPGMPFDEVVVRVGGEDRARVPLDPSPGVAEHFPWIPEARRASFRAAFFLEGACVHPYAAIEIRALRGGEPRARNATRFVPGFTERVSPPPPHLMERVSACRDLQAFRLAGLATVGEFWSAWERHRAGTPLTLCLDWGCGCGRLSSIVLACAPDARLTGCDIDAEAVKWCRAHLKEGRFRRIDTAPPTPFRSGEFDLVLGYSVLTHLAASDQRAWIRELARVVSPRGLVLATVHGPGAALFSPDPGLPARLERDGFVDAGRDGRLDGVTSDREYYRVIFQTPEWTRETFERGTGLRVVEHAERAMSGYQDLVVLEKA